jgi:hypothetical protein
MSFAKVIKFSLRKTKVIRKQEDERERERERERLNCHVLNKTMQKKLLQSGTLETVIQKRGLYKIIIMQYNNIISIGHPL